MKKTIFFIAFLLFGLPVFAMQPQESQPMEIEEEPIRSEAESALEDVAQMRANDVGASYLEQLPPELAVLVAAMVPDDNKKFYEFLPAELRPLIKRSVQGKMITRLPEFAKLNLLTQIIYNFPWYGRGNDILLPTINSILGLSTFAKIAASPKLMDQVIGFIAQKRNSVEGINQAMIAASLKNSSGALEWLKKSVQRDPKIKAEAWQSYHDFIHQPNPDQDIMQRYLQAGVAELYERDTR